MTRCLALLPSALPMLRPARSLFGNEWAEGHEPPQTIGVGADTSGLHQDCEIPAPRFDLPAAGLDNPGATKIANRAMILANITWRSGD